MTYAATARAPHVRECVVFRGTTVANGVTTPVAFGTAYYKSDAGLVRGIMRGQSVRHGTPEAVGAAPERVTVGVELDNSDGWLNTLLAGTASTDPANEYSGASVLNLRGNLYHVVFGADGTAYEMKATPTLSRSGPIQYDGQKVRVQLSSKDDEILGETPMLVTVRMLKEKSAASNGGPALGDGEGWVYGRTSSTPLTHARFTELVEAWNKALETALPYCFGAIELPLIQVADAGRGLSAMWIAGLSVDEPFFDGGTYNLSQEIFGRRPLWRDDFTLYKIPRWIDFGGSTGWRVVWVLLATLGENDLLTPIGQRPQPWEIGDGDVFVTFTNEALPGENPVQIIRKIVGNLSVLRGAALDLNSIFRAQQALPLTEACGLRVDPTRPLWDAIRLIAEPFALSLWITNDDTLAVAVEQPWSASDFAALATAEHIRMDRIASWRESIPTGANERGAAVTRLVVNWGDRRLDFWQPAGPLPRVGLTNTKLPLGEEVVARVTGEALNPLKANEILASAALNRQFVRRRLSLAIPQSFWKTVPLGTIVAVAHTRGITATGSGYWMRAARLERCTWEPNDGGCVLELEDLGSVQSIRPWVLDKDDNWSAPATGFDAGVSIELQNGSNVVVANGPVFSSDDEGRNLHTHGATEPGNRGSRRIVSYLDPSAVEVEHPYVADEIVSAGTIPGLAAQPWNARWRVMRTHFSETADYRPEYLRLCDEVAGEFSEGTPGYRYLQG